MLFRLKNREEYAEGTVADILTELKARPYYVLRDHK
jgi:hypothetical protein